MERKRREECKEIKRGADRTKEAWKEMKKKHEETKELEREV